jgi:hypothetical protein
MRIIYTKHAEERLDMRGISKKLIEKTLFDPDEVIQENEEIKIAQKVVKDKMVRVVFKEKAENLYIMIIAYLTTIERYKGEKEK